MKKYKKILKNTFLVTAIALASMSANAELISTDWKSTGDSKSTLDTNTGLEFLDFTQTVNQSYEQIMSRTNGGDLDGWRLATAIEMENFYSVFTSEGFSSFNSSQGHVSSGQRYAEADSIMSLLGSQFLSLHGNGNWFSTLKYDNGDNLGSAKLTKFYYKGEYSINFNIAYSGAYGGEAANSQAGWAMVSEGGDTLSSILDPSINLDINGNPAGGSSSVPISSSFILMGLAMTGFRLRKNKK